MTAAYAWIIHTDHMGDEPHVPGTIGPSDAPDDLIARLHHGDGHPFRLYDDDGERYYSGRIAFDPPTSIAHLNDHAFGPLDDFGGPNAGCTEIRYQTGPKGSWEAL